MAKPRTPNLASGEQFQQARRRIEESTRAGATELDLSGLNELSSLPPEIGDFIGLKRLDLHGTSVGDLTPIAGLTALQELRLWSTKISDLTPLRRLRELHRLDLDFTPVSDISPISALFSLKHLHLSGTFVSDISPLSDLSGLETLDLDDTQAHNFVYISGLHALRSLSLHNTPFEDLRLIQEISGLMWLSLRGTRVRELSPVLGLQKLFGLRLDDTLVNDLEPLSRVPSLRSVSFKRTNVSDLSPLSRLTSLTYLSLDDTSVADLSAVSDLIQLQSLHFEDTQISDMSPLAQLTSLQDAAVDDFDPLTQGLWYNGSAAAKMAPFDHLVMLKQPACTVETINEIRRHRGLAPHIPNKYEPPAQLPTTVEPANEQEDERDGEHLAQRPASHSFVFRGRRIEAQAEFFLPRYPEIAGDIRNEVADKAREARQRLATCNAPIRLTATVDRLASSLGTSLHDIRAGVLQMRFRSLEADVAVYDTEEGQRELPVDALAMLRDLASSVEDLMACFPQLAEVEAERLAQRLKDADVPQVIELLSEIRHLAEESEAVSSSAVEALKVGEPELEHDTEIIDSGASEAARAAAIVARDRTVGSMLLVHRNFVAGAIKVGGELAGLGGDTWKEFRTKAPDQLSDAAVALTIAGLVTALLGPVAGMGAFAASFKPLRDRAKRVTDKLAAMTKRSREPAESKEEERS